MRARFYKNLPLLNQHRFGCLWLWLLNATFLCFQPGFMSAQSKENLSIKAEGTPFFRFYQPQEFNASRQSWSIVQDQRGIILVANSQGLLSFDGLDWQLIPTPNGGLVRSLAMDESGVVYYGGKNDFGYLSSDSLGHLQLKSLRGAIPADIDDFRDVWTIQASGERLYFHSYLHLFVLGSGKNLEQENRSVEVLKTERNIQSIYVLNDTCYFYEEETGMKYFIPGEAAKTVVDGASIKDATIVCILPWFANSNKHKLILCSMRDGLFTMDEQGIAPFALTEEAADLIATDRILHACYLSDGSLGVATSNHGLVVIDEQGRLRHHLDEHNGFPTNDLNFLAPDRQDGLWIATSVGIARVEIPASMNRFATSYGLGHLVHSFGKHNDELYLGTNNGLFVAPSAGAPNFQRVAGPITNVYSIASVQGDLLAAFPYDGIFQATGQGLKRILGNVPIKLQQSRYFPDLVFAGGGSSHFGFSMLLRTPGGWQRILTRPLIMEEIRYVEEESPGIIWLGSRRKGFLRVEIAGLQEVGTQDTLAVTVERYPETLSTSSFRARPYYVHDQLYFASSEGLKRIDRSEAKLLPDSSLGPFLADSLTVVNHLLAGSNKEIWVNYGRKGEEHLNIGRLIPDQNGDYQLQKIPELARGIALTSMFFDSINQMLWLGTPEGVIKYNPAVDRAYLSDFPTLIRSVFCHRDSLIYGGDALDHGTDLPDFNLAYRDNVLRFEFSAASFERSEDNVFQHYLEGFDANWSEWSPERRIDYTNLPEGTYTFRVRAKNPYGVIGQEATFPFTVRPPWYRTWWAYLLYAGLIGWSIWGLYRFQSKRLKLEHRLELEQKESERLKELENFRTRLYTNITHEFRTPLTVILGNAQKLEEQKPDDHAEKKSLSLIRRNGSSLLNLVNQMLDLSKMEHGGLPIHYQQGDIVQYLRYIAESFYSLANANNVMLKVVSNEVKILLDYDEEKIRQIIANLLTNAIRHTPSGGKVVVEAAKTGDQLNIKIADTGTGIPEKDLPHIFNRFYQADEKMPRYGGTGIGLALTRELVKLLGGSITVESKLDKGTTFLITLPIRNNAPLLESQPITKAEHVPNFPITTIKQQIQPKEAPQLLIIEDNLDVVEYLNSCLETDYRLEYAYNGRTGIEKAFESIPDIIISDVMMPEKTGLEVTDALKNDARTSHIPIVLLTAKVDIESRIAGLQSGADVYLAKPFHQQELMVTLENLLDLRRKLQTKYQGMINEDFVEDLENTVVPTDPEQLFLQKLNEAIEAQIDRPELSAEEVAKSIGVSRSNLYRKLSALTGMSFNIYLRTIRLNKAKVLLKDGSLNISEVAYQVGFANHSYFSKHFSKQFGQSPSQMREKLVK